MNQTKLSKKLGVSRTYLNGILRGKRTPSVELAKRIIKINGMDFFYFRPDLKKLFKELL